MTHPDRKFTRVEFQTVVKLTTGSTEILASRVKDISLGGLYLETETAIPMGTDCSVEIDLTGPASLLRISVEGEVVRSEENGVGLRFTRIDADSLIHLRHIVKIHAQDPNRIDREYFQELLEVE